MGGSSSSLADAEEQLFRDGLQWHSAWRSAHEPKNAEHEQPTVNSSDVPIGSDGLHIHTVECTTGRRHSEGALPLVAMHGYGTGAGIYYGALPALADRWDGRVIAIDSLGCGLSSRPHWDLGYGSDCRVEDAEAFFLDGLEQWREAMSIEKMVLMGHSLGGYLAVAYAEKYPDRVERLILVSAVGTPEPPPMLEKSHWPPFSPFSVAKAGLASTMLGAYVRARFSDASWVLKPQLKAYLVGSWTDGHNSAGGYSHATLLQPGGSPAYGHELAYAREPMGRRRIPALAVGRISAIYGQTDWMNWRHMAKVRGAIAAAGGAGPAIEILHVADANHNVQVDNPLGFVDAVMATAAGDGRADGQMFGRRYRALDRAHARKASAHSYSSFSERELVI